MRLVKMFGLAAPTAVAAMALVGATSASSLPTQLCTEHTELECPEGQGSTSSHLTLLEGTVGKWLSPLVNILCLSVLVDATPLALGTPQNIHILESSYAGCGTGSAHNNCTVTVEEEPLGTLLKTGLDTGTLSLESGRIWIVCPNLGIDCKYDTANVLFTAGSMMLTANETPTTELGKKFPCPHTGKFDELLLDLPENLEYILS